MHSITTIMEPKTNNITPFTIQSHAAAVVSGYLTPQRERPHHQTPQFALPIPTRNRPRLLWVGDATVPTGFATVTHALADRLHSSWNVLVSGINCEKPSSRYAYPVVPARQKDDMWGIDSFRELCDEYRPDVVVINNDWWNVARFLEVDVKVPIVAYMPVDGANIDPEDARILNRLSAAIWYTDFGWKEARASGYHGKRYIVPHGVTKPVTSRLAPDVARARFGMNVPKGAFVVGNINRNQPRKRLDLTIDYFAAWIRENRIDDAWLCLHCSHSEEGWDLKKLARYHGVADRLVLTEGSGVIGSVDRDELDLIYQCFDVQVTTTSGEGWGLTTMEGMSHGIPQIVPDWAALGEWPDAVLKVPCDMRIAHPGINTIGALPAKAPFIGAIDQLYQSSSQRKQLGAEGLAWVSRREFDWDSVSAEFQRILSKVAANKPGISNSRIAS